MKVTLLQSSSITATREAAKALPENLLLLKHGENTSTHGNITVGPKTCRMLERNQASLGYDRVAIDFNHCTVPGSPDHVPGKPLAIFGYGRPCVTDAGLALKDIVWTPLGKEHALNYEDISPAVRMDDNREVDFVHSVALTPNGALYGRTVASSIISFTAEQAATGKDQQDKFKQIADRMLQLRQRSESVTIPPELAPDTLLLLKWGGNGGNLVVSEETARLLPENQKKFGLLRVPVFNPESEATPKTLVAEGTPRVSGRGVELVDLRWTPEGLQCLLDYSALEPSVWYEEMEIATPRGMVGFEEGLKGLFRVVVAVRSASLSLTDDVNEAAFPKFLRLTADQQDYVLRGSVCLSEQQTRIRDLIRLRTSPDPLKGLTGIARAAAAFNRQIALQNLKSK